MSVQTEELSVDLLEQVLSRLGLAERPAPTLDGLQTLYAAWCRKVPFDNVRKLIHFHSQAPGPLPGDDPAEFLTAWLTYGTGGTCWAGNGALHAVLVALGFGATRGMGTMRTAPDAPPTHGTVLVTCEETWYVVDASILHSAPLPLHESVPTGVAHPAWGVHCSKRDGIWYIRWRPVHQPDGLDCRLQYLHVSRETFRERHEQTRTWSPFNYELYARANRGETVVGIAYGQRVAFDHAGGVSHTALGGDDRLRVLVDELGMHEEIVSSNGSPWIRRHHRRHGPRLHKLLSWINGARSHVPRAPELNHGVQPMPSSVRCT
jgi:N-hydroxyarylamine O-acetyltransferase